MVPVIGKSRIQTHVFHGHREKCGSVGQEVVHGQPRLVTTNLGAKILKKEFHFMDTLEEFLTYVLKGHATKNVT